MRVLVGLLAVVACSRTVEVASQKDEHAHEERTEEVRAGGTLDQLGVYHLVERQEPTRITETAGWDEIRFADEPQASSSTPPHWRKVVMHHPAVRVVEVGARTSEAGATQQVEEQHATVVEQQAAKDVTKEEKRSEERKTRVGPPWWVLVLGALALLPGLYFIARKLKPGFLP